MHYSSSVPSCSLFTCFPILYKGHLLFLVFFAVVLVFFRFYGDSFCVLDFHSLDFSNFVVLCVCVFIVSVSCIYVLLFILFLLCLLLLRVLSNFSSTSSPSSSASSLLLFLQPCCSTSSSCFPSSSSSSSTFSFHFFLILLLPLLPLPSPTSSSFTSYTSSLFLHFFLIFLLLSSNFAGVIAGCSYTLPAPCHCCASIRCSVPLLGLLPSFLYLCCVTSSCFRSQLCFLFGAFSCCLSAVFPPKIPSLLCTVLPFPVLSL